MRLLMRPVFRSAPLFLGMLGLVLLGCGGSGRATAPARVESHLVITEVNPSAGWLEVLNPGLVPISLTGAVLEVTDLPRWPLPAGELDPGERIVVAPGEALPGAGQAKLFGVHRELLAQIAWRALAVEGASYGRTASGHWQRLPTATPGEANAEPLAQVVINEVCADNESVHESPDDPGAFVDWIELHNVGSSPIDLGGYTVTDDVAAPVRWRIPAGTVLAPGAFLVVHADDQHETLGGLHAAFKLSADGDEVGLFEPLGRVVDAIRFVEMDADASWGRRVDGGAAWVTFSEPTPGQPNALGEIDLQGEPTHRKGPPNYAYVYDTSVIRRLDITLTPEAFAGLRADVATQFPLPYRERDFTYVEGTVACEGEVWEHVGVRYKGNSSLSPYGWGAEKLSLKLDFDEFEDSYPATKNQRFHGIKKLVLNNSFRDPTLLRELLCLEALRELGAHASRVTATRVFMNGAYWGLYISVEQVDGRFLTDRFGDDEGNLYKPWGSGGQLTHFDQETFEKKTNKGAADWSDIQALIEAVNDPLSDLGSVFDVDGLLAWLAVSSALCNLDSFATSDHNYYLYNDPESGRWRFIPWDHTEAFGLFQPAASGLSPETIHTYDIDHPQIGTNPLLDRVLADPTWRQQYVDLVRAALAGPLSQERIDAQMDAWHARMRPYVIGPMGERAPHTLLAFPDEFDLGLDTSTASGVLRVLGLREFLDLRRPVLEAALGVK